MTKQEIKQIIELSSKKQFIYFDCFDTLLYRKHSPEYIYQSIGEFLIREFGFPENIVNSIPLFFWRCDIPFEQISKDIYLHYGLNSKIDFSLFFECIHKVFIEAEIRNTFLSDNSKDLLKKLKENGKDIYLLSDYFLGKNDIKNVLGANGLDANSIFSDIYISCDVNADKNSGKIYDYVIKKKDASIMIGDNKICDYEIPKSKGIGAFLLQSKKIKIQYCKYNDSKKSRDEKFLKKLAKHSQNSYGMTYLYLLGAFCKKLYAMLEHDDFIYFLSRDGYYMKDIFDSYLEYQNEKNIHTAYLKVSRLSMLFANPKILDFSAEEFAYAFESHSQWKIHSSNELLHYLGFEEQEIRAFDDHQTCDNYFQTENYKKLWTNLEFLEILRKKNEEANEKFRSYIEPHRGKIITVDMGWRGTSQNDMKEILGPDVLLHGYYIGTTFCIGEVDGSMKTGVLFDYLNDNRLTFRSIYPLEVILGNDQDQIVCYRQGEDVYVRDNRTEIFLEYPKPIMDEIKERIISLYEYDKEYFISSDYLIQFFSKAQRKQSLKNIAKFNKLWDIQNRNSNITKPSLKDYISVISFKYPKLVKKIKRLLRKI